MNATDRIALEFGRLFFALEHERDQTAALKAELARVSEKKSEPETVKPE